MEEFAINWNNLVENGIVLKDDIPVFDYWWVWDHDMSDAFRTFVMYQSGVSGNYFTIGAEWVNALAHDPNA